MSTLFAFGAALLRHYGRFMTFSHDRRHLPAPDSAVLVPLSLLCLLAAILRDQVVSAEPLAWAAGLGSVLFQGIMYACARRSGWPECFAAYLILTGGTDFVMAAATGALPEYRSVWHWGLDLWGLAAFGYVYFQALAAKKKDF